MSFQSYLVAAAVAVGLSAPAASAATIDFSWASTPTIQSETFTMGGAFSLILGSYSGINAEQTGFVLTNDDTSTVLTTDSSACVAAGFPTCNLVTAATADGTVLLTGLTAGNYTLSIYDSATPASGSISFLAAIPLPASGLLLLGALGLAGWRRRTG